MTFEEVERNIEGSILKGQYLEAFLLQSTYIEGLFKEATQFETWKTIAHNRELDSRAKKMVHAILSDMEKMGFYKTIEYLYKTEFLKKEESDLLHSYREIRNKVTHSLVSKISEEDFNIQLKKTCEKGQAIMKLPSIVQLSKLMKSTESKIKGSA